MKITKYPQSCLLIETNNKKILVDPGVLKYKEEYFDIWNSADIILVTHKHGDHINSDVIAKLNKNIPIYSTREVKETCPMLNINVIKEKENIEMDNISNDDFLAEQFVHSVREFVAVHESAFSELLQLKSQGQCIEVVHAIHGYHPMLKGAKEVLENVGYIIDDKKNRIYITSDTICFNNEYKADILAIPVTGHGLTMTAFEASLYAKEVGASLSILTHMDNDMYPADLNYIEYMYNKNSENYKILEIGESLEI